MHKRRRREMGKFNRRLIGGIRTGAGALIVVGAWSMYVALSAAPASAATVGGTATIASPAQGNPPLSSGGSATVFTVLLPAQAACSGDTASGQFHVFSYLLPQGTDMSTDNFHSGVPSTGLGLVDANGNYYGAADTAPVTGQIIQIPQNFEWAGLLKVGETAAQLDNGTGVWEAGVACANSSGVVTDNWNTQVTFAASASDPGGFVWTAVPGVGTTTTTTTTTTPGSSTTTSTTSTTAPPSTTSTTLGSGSGATTSTTVAGVSTASSGSDPSSGTGSGTTLASSGSLAFTGAWMTRDLAIGLLFIGLGLVMMGLSVRWRREVAHGISLS
jgi:hypothetical protein